MKEGRMTPQEQKVAELEKLVEFQGRQITCLE